MRLAPALIVCVSLAVCLPHASAIDCPTVPKTAAKDWQANVAVALGRLGPQLTAGELDVRIAKVEADVLAKLPRADRVYLETMMYAAACSSIRDDRSLTESQRHERIDAVNEKLRAALEARLTPGKTQSALATKNSGWYIPQGVTRMFVFAQDPKNRSPAGCRRLANEVNPARFQETIGFNMAEAKRLNRQLIVTATPGGNDWSHTARRITFNERELTPEVSYWCNGGEDKGFLLEY